MLGITEIKYHPFKDGRRYLKIFMPLKRLHPDKQSHWAEIHLLMGGFISKNSKYKSSRIATHRSYLLK